MTHESNAPRRGWTPMLALWLLPLAVAAHTPAPAQQARSESSSVSAGAGARSTAGAPPEARARYARESAACSRIAEHGARANCLSEASTRLAATLPTAPGENAEVLRQNALRRCEALPDEERMDCVARMNGHGTVSGSVEGGGVYRELVTRQVGIPPKAASAP